MPLEDVRAVPAGHVPKAYRCVGRSGQYSLLVSRPSDAIHLPFVPVENVHATSSTHVPMSNRIVSVPGDRVLTVRAEDMRQERRMGVELYFADGEPTPSDRFVCLTGEACRADIAKLRIGAVTLSAVPIEVSELRQRSADRRLVQAKRDESSFRVERIPESKRVGLESRPLRTEGVL